MKFLPFIVAVGIATQASAAVLLTIDPSNPSAVTFAATSNAAEVDEVFSTSTLGGITLVNILAAPNPAAFDPRSSSGASSLLSDGMSIDRLESITSNDGNTNATSLTLWDNTSNNGEGMDFSTSSPAFSGSAAFDLSEATFTIGSTGNIISGDTVSGSGSIIGQWRVVPEPSSSLLLALAGLLALRRKR
ncbi:MAG: PEP-CTERM sorting domain-containing protein [Verrucomicrobiota bacterium]